ncbi:hypothetical protein TRVA0_012S00540 [Trichomonascus vanleenenianus]|uniref:uncharacterized protein n=1 Tax=Trichomonascus vanleenenianus TaxID=2268995 RepID=UPI003EC9D94A
MPCLSVEKRLNSIYLVTAFALVLFAVLFGYRYRDARRKLSLIRYHKASAVYDSIGSDEETANDTIGEDEADELEKQMKKGFKISLALAIPWSLAIICCALSVIDFGCQNKVNGFLYFILFVGLFFLCWFVYSASLSQIDRKLDNQLAQYLPLPVLTA